MECLVRLLWTCVGLSVVTSYIPDDLDIPLDPSIPRIRPLRRQIRNFEPGRTGEITVVYQTTHVEGQTVRWFRKARNLPKAEIPNHLPTAGDGRYEYRTFSLNDMFVVTLRVRHVALQDFPYSFVLVLDVGYRIRIEYQLDIVVKAASRYPAVTPLDEIRWVVLPGDPTSFTHHSFLGITCVAVLDSEDNPPKLTVLQMYHVVFDKEDPPFRHHRSRGYRNEVGNITSVGIGKMFRKGRLAEETSSYMMMGSHTTLPGNFVRIEVTRRIRNATDKDEGAYGCTVDREQDRLFASSWVRKGLMTRKPSLDVLPCDSLNTRSYRTRQRQHFDYRLRIHTDRETCLRCRAYSFPSPELRLLRNNVTVISDNDHHISLHEHVADGGFMELTFTLWQPNKDDSGLYECRAYHEVDNIEKLVFKLDVR